MRPEPTADRLPYLSTALGRTLGDRHPSTLASTFNLSLLVYSQGDEVEAKRLCREAVTGAHEALGLSHPYAKAFQQNPWGIQ